MTATGFVLIDKPPGPTSHDIVDVVRRSLGTKRVGHAGTLDPPASGLLVVAVGPATRFLRYVQGLPKTYEATGVLGVRTSTLDATGEVLGRIPVEAGPEDVRAAADTFVGEIDQVPPAISAVKVGGERAYRRARRGEDVELAPRRVVVYSLEVTDSTDETFDVVVRCSSGTYIRSLMADIGERLGCGAHCSRLRRTAIGHLSVTGAVGPEDVRADAVRSLADVLGHLERVDVEEQDAVAGRNGRRLANAGPDAPEILVCGPDGAVGVFERTGDMLRALTVLGSGRAKDR